MQPQSIRPLAIRLHTPHGPVELDMSDPCLLRARAGHGEGNPPLCRAGGEFGLDMAFGWHESSDRFGLLAESGPMAWTFDRPSEPVPHGWKAVALAVEIAVMGYIDATPDISATAKRFSTRTKLGIQSPEGMNPAILRMRQSLLDMIAA